MTAKKKKKKSGGIFWKLLFLIALAVFCFSMYQLVTIYLGYKQGVDEYHAVAEATTVQSSEPLEVVEEKKDEEGNLIIPEEEEITVNPPEVDFDAEYIDMAHGLNFDIVRFVRSASCESEDGKHSVNRRLPAETAHISVNYKGFYNIYNILAAYSAARTGGMELKNFAQVLQDFNPQNGRMEQFHIGNTDVILNLAKNPAGFNQNISAVMEDKREKDLIIVINDNAQDGTDISWLWDVDFDRFAAPSIRSITVSGIRCQDMRLRMKYVDIESELIADVQTAIRKRIADGCGNLYVLVNYTALFSTRNILANMH